MKYLFLICRLWVGFALLAFGFVRNIDAVGLSYKIAEYFKLLKLDEFELLTLPVALIFCTACVSAGIGLLLRVKMRTAAIVALLLSGIASATSYISLNYDVVHESICFGDIFETNNASHNFYLRLSVFLGALMLSVNYLRSHHYYFNSDRNSSAMFLWGLFSATLGIYGALNLPIIDFRPYKVGVNILENMTIPETAPQFEYTTILYYRDNKNGTVKAFTEDNYPWQDTINWTYQYMENKMTKKGYLPPITDFSVKTEDETDITLDILRDTSYNLLLIATDVTHANLKPQPKINLLYEFCKANGYSFICLTASAPKQIARFKIISSAEYEFCTTDATVLKTIITSNPGLLLLKNGVIINKWHYNNIPDIKTLKTKYKFIERKES